MVVLSPFVREQGQLGSGYYLCVHVNECGSSPRLWQFSLLDSPK